MRRLTRNVDDVWEDLLPFHVPQKGQSTPRNPMLVSRDAHDAHTRSRRVILHCEVTSNLGRRTTARARTRTVERGAHGTPPDVTKIGNNTLAKGGVNVSPLERLVCGGVLFRDGEELDEEPAILEADHERVTCFNSCFILWNL